MVQPEGPTHTWDQPTEKTHRQPSPNTDTAGPRSAVIVGGRPPPPPVSPRVSRCVRCTPHGIPEYDIANDGFPADSAPPRPPRRPTRTPPHQRGSTASQTRRRTRRSAVHSNQDTPFSVISHSFPPKLSRREIRCGFTPSAL